MEQKLSESEVRDQLHQLLADMQHPKEVGEFLDVFLSPNVTSKLARRVEALKQFEIGLTYKEVKQFTQLPTTSVTAMSEAVALPIGQRVLERLRSHSWATSILKKIETLLQPDHPQQREQTL